MKRRDLLARVAIMGSAAAMPIGGLAQRVLPTASKMAESARALGFQVTDASVGGPALFNVWRRLNDVDSVLCGWIYRDGTVIWEGVMFEAAR